MSVCVSFSAVIVNYPIASQINRVDCFVETLPFNRFFKKYS